MAGFGVIFLVFGDVTKGKSKCRAIFVVFG